MAYYGYGRVTRGVGGLFTVRLLEVTAAGHPAPCVPPMPLDGATVTARGRGTLHRKGSLLVGDLVRVGYDDGSFTHEGETVVPAPDGAGISIDEILPRRNSLIRPPMANLDRMFVTLAAATPEPVLETVDKLIAIAEFHSIEPVIVVTKSDLAPEVAERLATLYRRAGFSAFCVGRGMEAALEALRQYIDTEASQGISAFAGASGVGKSTLMNALFPSLSLETGEISHRIERGKNTTRRVDLYPLSETSDCGYLADTPGFTMLDFERFDFFSKEDLPETFREFRPLLGSCRYRKCTHVKEEGCAIVEAVRDGSIARSRHKSFVDLYEILKKKTNY